MQKNIFTVLNVKKKKNLIIGKYYMISNSYLD